MIERVIEYAGRHAMFGAGQHIGVAVSGGADSVCLLHVLVSLRERFGIQLSVLHLDHQLRQGESTADAEFVERLAVSHQLPFHLERKAVGAGSGNLEEKAREARREFFRQLRSSGVVDKVATGHTRSDQAETVLFRLLRGTGTTGLAGILPVTDEGVIRPLLAVSRKEVEEYLRVEGMEWREDSTNRSLRFTRNRIRHELIPLLERDYQPALEEQLSHLAERARDEDSYLDQLAEREFGVTSSAGGAVLDGDRLGELPAALARRVIRAGIRRVKGDLREIEFRHVESILKMVRGGASPRRLQIPGLDVRRSFGRVRFAALDRDTNLIEINNLQSINLYIPSLASLPGGVNVRLQTFAAPERGYNSCGTEKEDRLDWDLIEGPLTLRYWSPGDAYRPAGAKRSEKLKQMFQIARIPLWERRFWPIIETSQGIVWSRRFGPSAAHQATPASRRILRIEEIPAE